MGEDTIIDFIMKSQGLKKWSWLDIGAHDPKYISNTAMWYDQGMHGINVEANPLLIKLFFKSRPKDINLNIAVAEHDGEMDFYLIEPATLSTLSEDDAKELESMGHKIKEKIKIKKSV